MERKSIFNYKNFSDFVENDIEKNTQLKRGYKKLIADALNIHPSYLSQILNQEKTFTEDQVYVLTEFLGLTYLESEYVMALHQLSRTFNKNLKTRLSNKLKDLKSRSLNLSERVIKDKDLSDEEKSILFSSWQYSAIQAFISIDDGKTKEEICKRLGLEKKIVSEILEFLVKAQLCKYKDNKYSHIVKRIHLEKSSPHLKQHHSNWRIKSIQKKDNSDELDLSFTAPLSLSNKDYEALRESLVKVIQTFSDTVSKTDPEDVFCFNLDFFKI